MNKVVLAGEKYRNRRGDIVYPIRRPESDSYPFKYLDEVNNEIRTVDMFGNHIGPASESDYDLVARIVKVKKGKKQLAKIKEAYLDMLMQSCGVYEDNLAIGERYFKHYDSKFLSYYEAALALAVELGWIKKEDVSR